LPAPTYCATSVEPAIPIVFANVLQSADQLTDAFWVGRLGGAAVAAVSVSFPVIFLSIALGMGFGKADRNCGNCRAA